jgi:hypothetical protein
MAMLHAPLIKNVRGSPELLDLHRGDFNEVQLQENKDVLMSKPPKAGAGK